MNLNGKVVVVTGAGMGIGKGIAAEVGQHGGKVVLAEINERHGAAVEKELRERQLEACFIRTDVSDESSVRSMVNEAVDRYGRIDGLVNNAGVNLFKKIEDTSVEEWEQVMNVDLKGIYLCSKWCIPQLKQHDGSAIVNISSVHAHQTMPEFDAYVAAKGGVLSLTRAMALSMQKDRIRVNGIAPGYIHTPMLDDYMGLLEDADAYMNHIRSIHPAGRIGTPKDIANAAVFLLSEYSSFINGFTITVDGGLSAQLRL